jgi:hypothetical protein
LLRQRSSEGDERSFLLRQRVLILLHQNPDTYKCLVGARHCRALTNVLVSSSCRGTALPCPYQCIGIIVL